MLNGKFFTGLPPKMMDRTAGAQNRLQSSLFWPDDTRVESAYEVRGKRRNSLQSEMPRSENVSRQTSWNGNENEVDTKQRFHKEFAKSSIHFCDNIQEEENIDGRNKATLSKLQARKHLKQEISPKPTAMKIELPPDDDATTAAQEEYTSMKKKQAYESKIQFYDYVDDHDNRRNNTIRPKMDMNDKRAVERNTKNSPKLQVKGIVRNFRMTDEQRHNDVNHQRDSYEPEKNFDHNGLQHEAHIIRNEVHEEHAAGKTGNWRAERDNQRNEKPDRSSRYDNVDDEYDENFDYYSQRNERPQQNFQRRAESVPKTIMKSYKSEEERVYDESNGGFHNELDNLERSAHNMRIRNSPRKHVTYDDEVYKYDRPHNGNYRSDNADDSITYGETRRFESRNTSHTSTANTAASHDMKNEIKSTKHSTMENNQRQQRIRPNTADYEGNPTGYNDQQHLEYTQGVHTNKSLNYKNKINNNNNNNNNNNSNSHNKLNNQRANGSEEQQQQSRSTLKLSVASMESNGRDSTTSPTSPSMDSQKHLRSSLCFHGGEIVANAAGSPTSEPSSRRTARSAATTRRVCVGLPD